MRPSKESEGKSKEGRRGKVRAGEESKAMRGKRGQSKFNEGKRGEVRANEGNAVIADSRTNKGVPNCKRKTSSLV